MSTVLNTPTLCHNIAVASQFKSLQEIDPQAKLALYNGRLFIYSRTATGILDKLYQLFLNVVRALFYRKEISHDATAIEEEIRQATTYSNLLQLTEDQIRQLLAPKEPHAKPVEPEQGSDTLDEEEDDDEIKSVVTVVDAPTSSLPKQAQEVRKTPTVPVTDEDSQGWASDNEEDQDPLVLATEATASSVEDEIQEELTDLAANPAAKIIAEKGGLVKQIVVAKKLIDTLKTLNKPLKDQNQQLTKRIQALKEFIVVFQRDFAMLNVKQNGIVAGKLEELNLQDELIGLDLSVDKAMQQEVAVDKVSNLLLQKIQNQSPKQNAKKPRKAK